MADFGPLPATALSAVQRSVCTMLWLNFWDSLVGQSKCNRLFFMPALWPSERPDAQSARRYFSSSEVRWDSEAVSVDFMCFCRSKGTPKWRQPSVHLCLKGSLSLVFGHKLESVSLLRRHDERMLCVVRLKETNRCRYVSRFTLVCVIMYVCVADELLSVHIFWLMTEAIVCFQNVVWLSSPLTATVTLLLSKPLHYVALIKPS